MSLPTSPQSASPIAIDVEPDYKRSVSPDLLRRAAEVALVLGKGAGAREDGGTELTIVITGDDQVQDLNREFLGEDHPTDVLSFPSEGPESPFVTAPEAAAYLGDVIISYPRAREQAEAAGHPVEAELQLLVVHGVLHLLGYDHLEAEEKEHMWAIQGQVLQALGLSISVDRE